MDIIMYGLQLEYNSLGINSSPLSFMSFDIMDTTCNLDCIHILHGGHAPHSKKISVISA